MAEAIGQPEVRVGQVYAGITGNRMVVLAVEGDRCQIVYEHAELNDEEPWWEDSDGVARYLTLVSDVS